MNTPEEGIVRPVTNDRTPRLGPLVIMVATEGDCKILRRSMGLPDQRPLFLSRIHYNSADQSQPALVGPVIGAPYAGMVLETLRSWGASSIVFYGWCGSISKAYRIGDILIPDSAIVDEGTSLHYLQAPGATVRPHGGVYGQLGKTLHRQAISHKTGRVWSTDGIFRETPSRVEKFKKRGCVAVEMELSALFSISKYYELSLAALLVVSDELFDMQWRPGFKDEKFKSSKRLVHEILLERHGSLFHE